MIVAVSVVRNRERLVAELLANRAEKFGVKAIVVPKRGFGYIFVEGSIFAVRELVAGVPHVKRVLREPVSVEEFKRWIHKEPPKLEVGDKVEVISGPFRGFTGKVLSIINDKEVEVELFETEGYKPIRMSRSYLKRVQ